MENLAKNYPDSNLQFLLLCLYPSSISFLLMSEKKYSPKLDLDVSYYTLILVILFFTVILIKSVPLDGSPFAFLFTSHIFLGIVQCFIFLGFLPLLENFGLAALIPVGIRVLGVETPL